MLNGTVNTGKSDRHDEMQHSHRQERSQHGPYAKGSPNVVDRLYKQMVALADGHGDIEQ